SGNYLRDNIIISAPAHFEVSTEAENGFSNTISLSPTDRSVFPTEVYVRSSSNASSGPISGEILLSTRHGVSRTVKVRGWNYAIPTVDAIPDQTFITGTTTSPIDFSGTANSFRWINDNPSIGLQANGRGSIPSFTANNGGGSDTVFATITAEPVSEA